MDHIKKLSSKVFKKGLKQRKDPKLRYSRSMPLNNPTDISGSYSRPRPIYRGDHPLKVSDIQFLVDISPEAGAAQVNPKHGWPRSGEKDDDDEYLDTAGPYLQRYPFIDRKIVDKFPAPPDTLPTPTVSRTPNRPAKRPPTMNVDELEALTDTLPDFTPEMKAKMDALIAARNEEARVTPRNAQRSNSNASTYTQGTTTYPSALGSYLDHIGVSTSKVYTNHARNFSTQSLGPNVHFRPGPVASTPSVVEQKQHISGRRGNGPSSYANTNIKPGMYSNPAGNTSTRSLGPNAQLRVQHTPVARHASIHPTIEQAPCLGSIRCGNGSSSSLAHPQNSYHTRTTQPLHIKKQPSRCGSEFEVINSDANEWGMASGANEYPMTVAGQGRGGCR